MAEGDPDVDNIEPTPPPPPRPARTPVTKSRGRGRRRAIPSEVDTPGSDAHHAAVAGDTPKGSPWATSTPKSALRGPAIELASPSKKAQGLRRDYDAMRKKYAPIELRGTPKKKKSSRPHFVVSPHTARGTAQTMATWEYYRRNEDLSDVE